MNMGIASMLKLFAPLTMRCSRMSIEGPPLTQSRVMQLMPMENATGTPMRRQTASATNIRINPVFIDSIPPLP